MMGVGLNPHLLEMPQKLFMLISLAIILGVIAGLTPAFYLSSKNILNLFKENLRSNNFQHFPIRKYLIINQFVILIGITTVSYFISKQIDFIENKDMGFQKEGIVYAYSSPENQNVFQQKLRQIPDINTVGNGSSFGITTFNKMTYKLANKTDIFDDAQQLYLDYEALKAYQLKTTLDKKSIETTEKKPVLTIINRTAAEKLAKVQQTSVDKIIGTTVITEPEYVAQNGQVGTPFTIAGIFEDIHLFSLHEKIEPYFITISENVRIDGCTIIAYNPSQTAQVLAKIQGIYNELKEPFPLELTFLSDNIAAIHQTDSRTANLLFYFNIIAVLLASIGIIGITLFMVVVRTKEIGIRKILGASPLIIIYSLVREYIYFIGIALLIGYPIAYYGVHKWLSNFAYRIDIQHIMFLVIGVAIFMVTAVLVGVVAYKAALANPVKSLRTE
ncbi:MAG: FtsX-like permease family protein [Saprospiraceae bacterium]|nr:FtsX-like permease family protein [Saprospiraceae bacterium]